MINMNNSCVWDFATSRTDFPIGSARFVVCSRLYKIFVHCSHLLSKLKEIIPRLDGVVFLLPGWLSWIKASDLKSDVFRSRRRTVSSNLTPGAIWGHSINGSAGPQD